MKRVPLSKTSKYVYKSHTIFFYYINSKYDKSKLETEEHVDDYFTCTYSNVPKVFVITST